jgi:hypothetical protein
MCRRHHAIRDGHDSGEPLEFEAAFDENGSGLD